MNYLNPRMKKFAYVIGLLFMVTTTTFAQQNFGKIKGTVTTSDSELAIGVNIILKNSKYGTITNEDGVFEFNRVKANTYTLQVSLTGYETKTSKTNCFFSGELEDCAFSYNRTVFERHG